MTTPTRPFYPQEGPLEPYPDKDGTVWEVVERKLPPANWRAPLDTAKDCFELSMLDWASRDH